MKRITPQIFGVLGVSTGLAASQALVNLGGNDVDIVASLTTQKQVGTTVPTFVSAIQSDLTLTADKTYLLKDAVFVTDGAKLTIEAGKITEFFAHLHIPTGLAQANTRPIRLHINIDHIDIPDQAEIIRAMAEGAACGDHCCGTHA